MIPQYTSTLLLAFILASCFYRKHIRDWWWFKLGLFAYGGGLALILPALLLDAVLRSGHAVLAGAIQFLSGAAVLLSGVAFVVACFKDGRRDIEHLRCLGCGYILKGLSEPRCPECGLAI